MRKLLVFLAICGAFTLAAPAAHAGNGTVSGTVTYASNGAPIASVYVYLTNTSTNANSYALSESDGTYSVSVAPATYDVYAGFIVTDYSITFIKKVTTITVASDETKSGINLSVTRRGWFTGHVYKSDGVTPIADASMNIVNESGSSYGYVYPETSSTGVYSGTPTPSDTTSSAVGSYTITVTRNDYFGAQVTGVQLAADGAATTQDIRLTERSVVSGTVRDANAAAISGARVTVIKTTSGTSYTATTNASGDYAVSIFDSYPYNGTAVGDYTMTVTKAGYAKRTSRFSITSDATSITAKDFALVTGKVFSGTVTAKVGGAALANATVSLFKRTVVRSTIADFTATTAGDGTFTINTLPAGKYRLQIAKTGYATVVQDYVTITTDKTNMVYTLEVGGTLTGQVYTGNRVGIDGATVTAYPLNNGKTQNSLYTTADENGTYVLSGVKKGKYKLVFSSTDHIQQTVTVTIKTTGTTTKNVKMGVAGSISGYVTDKVTGLPINGSFGLLLVKVVGTAITAVPDTNGFFTLDGVTPGSRKITAVSGFYETPGQLTVKVSAGKTKTGANFSLTPRQ